LEARSRLIIRLPLRPTTVDQLRNIHFWFRTIFETCFSEIRFDWLQLYFSVYFQLNPDLIRLLFPGEKGPAISFRASDRMYNYDEGLIPHLFPRSLRLTGVPQAHMLLELAYSLAIRPRQMHFRQNDSDFEQLLEVMAIHDRI
jgi:hypothetical protein